MLGTDLDMTILYSDTFKYGIYKISIRVAKDWLWSKQAVPKQNNNNKHND